MSYFHDIKICSILVFQISINEKERVVWVTQITKISGFESVRKGESIPIYLSEFIIFNGELGRILLATMNALSAAEYVVMVSTFTILESYEAALRRNMNHHELSEIYAYVKKGKVLTEMKHASHQSADDIRNGRWLKVLLLLLETKTHFQQFISRVEMKGLFKIIRETLVEKGIVCPFEDQNVIVQYIYQRLFHKTWSYKTPFRSLKNLGKDQKVQTVAKKSISVANTTAGTSYVFIEIQLPQILDKSNFMRIDNNFLLEFPHGKTPEAILTGPPSQVTGQHINAATANNAGPPRRLSKVKRLARRGGLLRKNLFCQTKQKSAENDSDTGTDTAANFDNDNEDHNYASNDIDEISSTTMTAGSPDIFEDSEGEDNEVEAMAARKDVVNKSLPNSAVGHHNHESHVECTTRGNGDDGENVEDAANVENDAEVNSDGYPTVAAVRASAVDQGEAAVDQGAAGVDHAVPIRNAPTENLTMEEVYRLNEDEDFDGVGVEYGIDQDSFGNATAQLFLEEKGKTTV